MSTLFGKTVDHFPHIFNMIGADLYCNWLTDVKYLVLGIFICGNFAWILLYGHLSRDAILRIRQHFNTFSIASIIMHVFFMSHDKVIKCINSKGQEISEWKFEVVALPKIWTKKIEKFCPKYSGQNFSNFFVHILGNATTSYFHFEIYWPLHST